MFLLSICSLHRTSSSFCDHQDIHENSSTTYIHQTAKNASIHPHESTSSLGKALPPVNKNKKSNNIDISELVRNPPEDTSFRSKTLSKHFEHESGSKRGLNMNHKLNASRASNKSHGMSLSNGLSSSHGHKPLPNVGKQSKNSLEFCDGGGRHEHFDNTLEARLACVGSQGKGCTTSGGKSIGPLKERKTSVERLRSGLLVSALLTTLW